MPGQALLDDRITGMLPCQVRIFRAHGNPSERRSGGAVEPFIRELHRRMMRRPERRRAVVGEDVWRLEHLVHFSYGTTLDGDYELAQTPIVGTRSNLRAHVRA